MPVTDSILRAMAHRIRRGRPHIDPEDLIQAGRIAAWQAESRWDPGRGASLATYLTHRVRGAMLDEVRRASAAYALGGWRSRARGRPSILPLRRNEAAARTDDVSERLAVEDLIRVALRGRPREMRLALLLVAGYTLAAAGRIVGVCESMASKIRKVTIRPRIRRLR